MKSHWRRKKKDDVTKGGLDGGVVWLTIWQKPCGQRQGKPRKLTSLSPITVCSFTARPESKQKRNCWMIHWRKWRRYSPFLRLHGLNACPYSLPTTTLWPQVKKKEPLSGQRWTRLSLNWAFLQSHTLSCLAHDPQNCGHPSSCSEKKGNNASFEQSRHMSEQKQQHHCVFRSSCSMLPKLKLK